MLFDFCALLLYFLSAEILYAEGGALYAPSSGGGGIICPPSRRCDFQTPSSARVNPYEALMGLAEVHKAQKALSWSKKRRLRIAESPLGSKGPSDSQGPSVDHETEGSFVSE